MLIQIKINKIPVNNKKTVRYFNMNPFFDSIDYSVSKIENNIHLDLNLSIEDKEKLYKSFFKDVFSAVVKLFEN